MGTRNCWVTQLRQNIFYVQQKKDILHTYQHTEQPIQQNPITMFAGVCCGNVNPA